MAIKVCVLYQLINQFSNITQPSIPTTLMVCNLECRRDWLEAQYMHLFDPILSNLIQSIWQCLISIIKKNIYINISIAHTSLIF
jgi:hypothetical protein